MAAAAGRDGAAGLVAVLVGDHARQVWASLDDPEFAAIESLIVDLADVDEHGRLDALPIAASGLGPYHDFVVVTYGRMSALVATSTQLEVYAIGRPTH